MLENVQPQRQTEPAAIGRPGRPHLKISICRSAGFDIKRLVIREILEGQSAAIFVNRVDQFVRERAVVNVIGARVHVFFERAGERFLTEKSIPVPVGTRWESSARVLPA